MLCYNTTIDNGYNAGDYFFIEEVQAFVPPREGREGCRNLRELCAFLCQCILTEVFFLMQPPFSTMQDENNQCSQRRKQRPPGSIHIAKPIPLLESVMGQVGTYYYLTRGNDMV